MPHRTQPPRMPVQLVRAEAERAQSSSADRMSTQSRHADRPARCHSDPQSASICAQRAQGLLHLDGATRGLRNPRPVLAPDRHIVQHLPRHRRDHQTCRGSRAPYQQISSCDLHAVPFIRGTRGIRRRRCAVRGRLRSRSSSCHRAARAAAAISSVPRGRGCIH